MDKVKWGVLGTAGIAMGCTIPGMVQAENCELYAISGRNPEKVNEFKNKFGCLFIWQRISYQLKRIKWMGQEYQAYSEIVRENSKSYLLTMLFNAGSTMSCFYKAEVNHDMPQFAGEFCI